jgi:cytochrome c-type biogenesis protein CcmF
VQPNILYNKEFDNIAASNPDTKHYLHKDIFTHVANLPKIELDKEYAQQVEDSLTYVDYDLAVGETFMIRDSFTLSDLDSTFTRNYEAKLISLQRNATHPEYQPQEGDISAGALIEVYTPDSTYQLRPSLVLRGQMLFSFPDQIGKLTMKAKLEEEVFDQLLTVEQDLNYQAFQVKQGETIQVGEYIVQFAGFNRSPEHPDYQAAEGDIAVGAIMNVSNGKQNYTADPIFLIRDSRPMNVKDMVEEAGLHFRFNAIDPKTEQAEILIALQENKVAASTVPLRIATDAARTDFIVFEAIEFQGINLFWLGSIAMMLGFFVSLGARRKGKL